MKKIISCFAIAIVFFACSKEEALVLSDQESSVENRGALSTGEGERPDTNSSASASVNLTAGHLCPGHLTYQIDLRTCQYALGAGFNIKYF